MVPFSWDKGTGWTRWWLGRGRAVPPGSCTWDMQSDTGTGEDTQGLGQQEWYSGAWDRMGRMT